MRLLSLIIKEFKHNLRNWKANSMMILFPIILILILGAAFSKVFDNSIKLDDVRVLYTMKGSGELSKYFKEFTAHGKELGVIFEESSDVDAGIRSVKDVTYSSYILFEGNNSEVKYYKNNRYNFEASFVEGFVTSFLERYNALAEIGRTNPAALGRIMSEEGKDYVRAVSFDAKKQPRSIDYYAVTMLTLILMYASLTGFWGIKSEQNMRTGNRILCGPVHKSTVLAGKVIGSIFVTILQAAVVILFSKYVLGANWGTDIVPIIILVLAQSLMTISLGTGLAFLIKNEGAASGILNTIIPIIVLLGGGYTPLEQMGGSILKISDVSPVKWLNSALFRVIYDNDYSLVATAALINIAIAAVFIMTAAVLSRKEAA